MAWSDCQPAARLSHGDHGGRVAMGTVLDSGRAELRVAVAGLGSIGIKVVQALDEGIDGFVLAAVSALNPEKHRGWLAGLGKAPAVLPIEALADAADIVIECAPGNL